MAGGGDADGTDGDATDTTDGDTTDSDGTDSDGTDSDGTDSDGDGDATADRLGRHGLRRHRRGRLRHDRRRRVLSALDLLSGDAQTFLDKVWASRVHLHRTDPDRLVGLLSLDDADHLLTGTAIRTPSIRLAQDGAVRGRVDVHPRRDARRPPAHRPRRRPQGARRLRRRRDRRLPGPAPLLAAADPAGRRAGARARPPLPGQRLPHAARRPGLRRPLRLPRRLRLPDRRVEALGGAHPRRRRGRRPRARPVDVPPHRHPPRGPRPGHRLPPRHPRHQPAHLARPGRAQRRAAPSTRSPTRTCPPATSTTRATSPQRLADRLEALADEVRRVDAGRGRRRGGPPVPHHPRARGCPVASRTSSPSTTSTTPRCCAGVPATRACCSTPRVRGPARPARGAPRRPVALRPGLAAPGARGPARRGPSSARPTSPTCSTRSPGSSSAAAWSGKACSRSSGDLDRPRLPLRRRQRPARRARRRHRLDGAGVPAARARRPVGRRRPARRPAPRTASARGWPAGPPTRGSGCCSSAAPAAAPRRGTPPSSRRTPTRTSRGSSAATSPTRRDVLDLDLAAPARRPLRRADPHRRVRLLRLHPRPPRRLLRRAPAARSRRRSPWPTRRRPGRSPTSAATASPATCWCCRTASTTAGWTR